MRILIVGAGEVGFHIAQRLACENKDVVVIDTNPEALKRVAEQLDVQTVNGSGSSPSVLEGAGIKTAEMLLAVTDSDETNLIACFFGHVLSPGVHKVARFRDKEYTQFHSALPKGVLNISTVINPDDEVVKTVLRMLSVPGALEINEFADGRITMIGMRLPDDSPLAGTRMMHLRERTGDARVIFAAIIRDERLIIPTGRDTLQGGDIVYFVSDAPSLPKMLGFFGAKAQPIKDVLIIGGGNLGLKLAQQLEKGRYHVKLVDRSPEQGLKLSEVLNKTIVLAGDGTDQEFLTEENAGTMDAVLALTGDEETNILSCLLAKRMGARKTVARINKFAYMPLVQAIGLDHFVSPRLSAINSILHHIRRGKVLSTVSIKGEEAEAIEAVALEHSEIVGKPVKDLEFPRGAIILCILRGEEVLIPSGDFVIAPRDHIIILSTRPAVPCVERKLSVKLEQF